LGIAVEVADEAVAVFGGPFSQVVDESLDQVSAGLPQHSGSAVVSGVKFDQGGVELMLADKLTEAVAESRLAIAHVRFSRPIGHLRAFGRGREGPEFLDRAEADTISLAEGPIDRPGLGHAHLGASNP